MARDYPYLHCPGCGRRKHHAAAMCWHCRHSDIPECGRAQQVVVEIAKGKPPKQIAVEWGLTIKAVGYAWAKARAAYKIQSYVDAVWLALRRGWVSLEP